MKKSVINFGISKLLLVPLAITMFLTGCGSGQNADGPLAYFTNPELQFGAVSISHLRADNGNLVKFTVDFSADSYCEDYRYSDEFHDAVASGDHYRLSRADDNSQVTTVHSTEKSYYLCDGQKIRVMVHFDAQTLPTGKYKFSFEGAKKDGFTARNEEVVFELNQKQVEYDGEIDLHMLGDLREPRGPK